MDPNRWRQVEDLYHLALEKPAQERGAFLDRACSADPSLRQELDSLLAIADGADAYVKAAVREASFLAGRTTEYRAIMVTVDKPHVKVHTIAGYYVSGP